MDLKFDWRYGASYFEEQLIDHDVESNYGNWVFIASLVKTPPYPEPVDVLEASMKLTGASGKYLRSWIPELDNVPDEYIH